MQTKTQCVPILRVSPVFMCLTTTASRIGSDWMHLRTCQTCGVTLCCDSSPNRDASRHARGIGHPVIASAEPDERWLYCYRDELFAEY